jgi:uncharacterized protein (DUF2237 family)
MLEQPGRRTDEMAACSCREAVRSLLAVGDVMRERTMPEDHNVLGERLETCSIRPLSGFYRSGCCETDPDDVGAHVVCAEMTAEFLAFSKSQGQRSEHAGSGDRLSGSAARRSLVPLRRALEGGARRRDGAARGAPGDACGSARVRDAGRSHALRARSRLIGPNFPAFGSPLPAYARST